MKTIVINENFKGLNEVAHGEVELLFAFMDPNKNTNITPFFRCKDYANDLFWSEAVNREIDIYYFNWFPGKINNLRKDDRYHLLLRLTPRNNKELSKLIKMKEEERNGILSLLNLFSRNLGFNECTIEECSDGHVYLSYDCRWSDRPYTNSAFFLLLRLGIKYDGITIPIEFYTDGNQSKFISPYDIGYFKSAKNTINNLFNGIIDNNNTYDQYCDVQKAHDYSGIVAYTNKQLV